MAKLNKLFQVRDGQQFSLPNGHTFIVVGADSSDYFATGEILCRDISTGVCEKFHDTTSVIIQV